MIRKYFAAACMVIVFKVCNAQNLKLWYNQPATNWNEALPIGNGRLAATVFGGRIEQLQLNEETVWAGGPHNNVNADDIVVVPQLRKLINEKKFVEAQALANAKMFSKQNGMPYQTVGSLFIRPVTADSIGNYRRELDISKAVASVSYTAGNVHYKREIFASFSDKVIIVRLTADKPAAINCDLYFRTPMQKHVTGVNNNDLVLSGTTDSRSGIEGQVKFEAHVKALNDGGSVTGSDSVLNVRKANAITIYISIATNFKNYRNLSENQTQKALGFLNASLKKPYAQALREHVQFYQKYFNRLSFKLGSGRTYKPTDERIRDFNSSSDLSLVPLYYQFGRYLLISSSQPGGQAANLQGKWNDKTSPPWGGKYTININTEMNYWPAEETNLSELTEPLIHLIKDLSVTGRQSASQIYRARGWMAHHNTDIWRISGQVDKAFYGLFPTGGAWLTEHLWEHYLYTGDKEFLKGIYPVLKGASMYFVDALQVEPDHHWLVVSPSMSPEHSFMSDKSVGAVSITEGTTMDNQIVFELFSNTIAAARALGIDQAFTDTLLRKKNLLPPMQIGKWGQLQEWMEDRDKEGDRHRHISQLFGLYPGKQISPYLHSELQEAAKNILISRGDVSTGWSMGWKVNFWARLLDGNHAWKLIKDQLRPCPVNADLRSGAGGGTYPNLFDAHPPFQIDGNFGCTAGITEMLMQSYDGDIHLLPALPDDWAEGSIHGLVARGAFGIDMDWSKGKITKLVITSKLGGNCRIRVPNKLSIAQKTLLSIASGKNENPYYQVTDIKQPLIVDKSKLNGMTYKAALVYDLKTEAGKTYTLIGN